MRIDKRWILASTLALLSTTRLPAAQAQQPVFKAAAIHVQVDVIAVDKNDTPVTDLTVRDFEIRLKGSPQSIVDFEHVSIPAIDRKIDLKAPLLPPPTSFTNAPPPPNARAFVFLMWGLTPKNIVPIKRMMASFISTLQPEDEVAIVYANRSDLSQDFTNDAGKLIRAINNLNAAVPSFADLRAWVYMIHNILESLSSAHEQRRVLTMVSEGFAPLAPPTLEVIEVFDEAIRRNIPIYTMDPRGLMAPPLGLEGHLEDQRPNGLERIRSQQAEKSGLQVVAENTNGRAFINDWDVPAAAAALIGENNSYYLLGFYPSPYEADGKFHELDVIVKRPGVKIRARSGFTALAPPDPNAKPPQLIDSLTAGLPGGDLILTASVAPARPAAKKMKLPLSIAVQYPPQAAGRDELKLVWVAIDPDGGIRASGEHVFAVDVTSASVRVPVADTLTLPKGQMTIRLAVASQLTGTSGTVHIPIDTRKVK